MFSMPGIQTVFSLLHSICRRREHHRLSFRRLPAVGKSAITCATEKCFVCLDSGLEDVLVLYFKQVIGLMEKRGQDIGGVCYYP